MDKNSIKKYAVWARRELIERVTQKALKYGVTAGDNGDPKTDSVGGHLLSDTEKKQRAALISKIKEQGFEQVMEEAAYTWFNRFTALRFMEVNGYLPSRVRVFTDADNNFNPQILAEAIDLELDGLDMGKVYALKDANKKDELFKYLLIVQCNALSKILPGMFQHIEDYTELLLPDYLLREGSVIHHMIELIPEEDWTDQVQIIGWLYQYYNSEPKAKVFEKPKGEKNTKNEIAVATQLFTPDWIVRYMVENSLGRLWLEGHPNSSLKSEWKYYLDEAEQEEGIQKQLDEIRKEYADLTPEEILCIDPCMGSGHILCYLFDVLVRIYEDYGYTAREAVPQIIEKNLWGLDIDERAAQIAYFSVMMKAVQYDKRFLRREDIPQPHVYSPKGYADGEEFGSLLIVDELEPVPERPGEITLFAENYEKQLNRWNFRRTLAQKYHVVVTNPPYMGASNMNAVLSDFIKKNFADYKSDYFSAFFVRCSQMALPKGKLGFFSPYVWMFIQSYKKLRHLLCQQKTIETLIQFEYSAFEEATVPVCTFVFSNYHINKKGCYFRLTDFRGGMEVQRQKTLEAIANHDCGYYYEQSTDSFSKIPGSPVAYWLADSIINMYEDSITMKTVAHPKVGMQTSNNNKYLRLWHEIDYSEFMGSSFGLIWIKYLKGGNYRKWYGNLEYLLHYNGNPDYILQQKNARVLGLEFLKKKKCTWTDLTSGNNSFRLAPDDTFYDISGHCFFPQESDQYWLLAYANTKIFGELKQVFNSTFHCQVGDVEKIAVPILKEEEKKVVTEFSKCCVEISKRDWDSFETSWDFTRHPLVRPMPTVAEAYAAWEAECEERFKTLKNNEEELNRIFINIYGIQNELTPEVKDKDVTVRKANLGRDIRSLISYAVGCMFGRYSLDTEGLAYAGGAWDASKYKTFIPDADAILPISDDEYFSDDIVGRFVEFVRVVYGDDSLEENLKFIADALGGKGSSRAAIRNYFINNFYADHCKIYQKRPIYWLFDSGKKNGFKCLVYIHRYQPDTIARIRTDYVHEQQSRYRTVIAGLEQRINSASTSERVKLSKELSRLKGQETELRKYEEKIHHLADQMIHIDLDDGVKHNYEIFKDVLAKINK